MQTSLTLIWIKIILFLAKCFIFSSEMGITMKKSFLYLLSIFLIITLGCYGVVKIVGTHETQKDNHLLVSSFYPQYIILLNLVDNCDSIAIKNMTSSATGCLHDYQITSADMKKLDHADAFIINGGGMENFLDDILKVYPDIKIIDSCKNIELLENNYTHYHEHNDNNIDEESEEHSDKHINADLDGHEEKHNDDVSEEHSHEHGNYNAHVWLNPQNYIKQIRNITLELCKIYPNFKKQINDNSKNYINRISTLQDKIDILKSSINSEKKRNAIIFHDSFSYIADSFNLNIIKCIEIESDSSLSAGTIASTIDEIETHDIRLLLTEKQFKTTIADNIASETKAKVYVLDSLVTGDYTKDSYIKGMESNIKTIQKIFE